MTVADQEAASAVNLEEIVGTTATLMKMAVVESGPEAVPVVQEVVDPAAVVHSAEDHPVVVVVVVKESPTRTMLT